MPFFYSLKTTLFIPVRNEIDGLKAIMPRIRKEWVDEILFVDGNSTDGSREWLREQGFKVIEQASIGICGAYWECLEHATGDVIVAFSPDNNSIPEAIPQLIAHMQQGYDMVIASRYRDGAKSEDDDFFTRIGNWLFTQMVSKLFGVRYTDSLVMFRAFRKSLANELGMTEKILPVFEVQLCIRCAKFKKKICEIPVDEPKRIGGYRKMRIIYNGAAVLYIILKDFLMLFGKQPNHLHRA